MANSVQYGLPKWNQEYAAARPDISVLEQDADDYMTAFDDRVRQEREARAKERMQVDDDGFIKVVRGSKRGIVSDGKQTITVASAREMSLAQQSAAAKSESPANFYRFQLREHKKQQLLDLKKRFDEDKQRIAAMKVTRKFRPYA